MKQIIVLILFVLGGMCFAEPDSQSVHESESYQEVPLPAYHSDSAMFADSAIYYEELAARYKKDGDYLLKSSSRHAKIGVVIALLGVGGTIALLQMAKAKGASIEGGGAMLVFPAALTVGSAFGGIIMLSINGIRHGNGHRKIQQSEEYSKTAEQFREKAWKERYRRSSQMMLQIIPEIDPFNKTVGARLALSL